MSSSDGPSDRLRVTLRAAPRRTGTPPSAAGSAGRSGEPPARQQGRQNHPGKHVEQAYIVSTSAGLPSP
jgi:hypothetical protein